MKTCGPLRTTGTDAERLLLAAGSSERPDLGSVRRAAHRLGFLPGLLLFGGAVTLALRTARWSSIAARGLVPLAGFGAVAAVAYSVSVWAGPAPISAAARAGAGVAGSLGGHGVVAVHAPGQGGGAQSLASNVDVTASQPALVAGPSDVAVSRHASPAAKARVHASPSLSSDSLRQQAELLDRARARVASGDPAAALALLNDFDRRFAGAPLAEESLLLRVEALARRGDRSAASSLGGQFLGAYPASVHADRVRALLHTLSP